MQGHSEYQGEVVVALGRGGVTWLSNEGRRVGPGGGLLLRVDPVVALRYD